ncbi:NAD(P)H nitroreductase [Catenovulum sp. 2E275]|uniref:NAD(P)H nitroreductase n=1 Tax=Catenovulum sp. 2E275 TaxID=2980497 RepID=UPI0021D2077D|nr:NAD(P)H nitroreductase [Catenovulum sp. 2E275]MCU4674629.1 NAD(P)H nitroreductase [Catenovulum sp. 2E275]
MQALELLLNRSSFNQLTAPAPSQDALDNILKAGMRAPDHGSLTPFRFIVFQNEALNDLGEIFAEAAELDDAPCEKIEKAKNMPLRAPLIIAVIANVTEDHKIPVSEQIITAGCAVHAMQMAAVAQGFQGIWRTGDFAYHQHVRKQFKLKGEDQIVGYLYIGTPSKDVPIKPAKNLNEHVEYW